MKLRALEEVKTNLAKILEISHPGNMQLPLSDKCVLHYAECITDYDDQDNEVLTGLDCSFTYYGEHISATIKRDEDDYFSVGFAEGHLLSSFDDFIEDDDTSQILNAIWESLKNY